MNKKMKYMMIVMLIVGCCGVGFYSYQMALPRLTVSFLLDSLKHSDYDQFELEIMEATKIYERELLDSVFSTVDYEILDSSINGNIAYVTLNLTHIDIEKLMTTHYDVVIENSIKNIGSTLADIASGGIKKFGANACLALLQDERINQPYMTSELTLTLKKVDGMWIPHIDEEVVTSVFGGLK
ncbi:MAG: hypothetical protein ACRCST_08115 [Turicibacter sp.]